ncbi:hypothetical protein J6590_006519 [Homalodisca vitripennis]|nr:hypothetical protein J6590_006519 [Homalodisca vitripennis]
MERPKCKVAKLIELYEQETVLLNIRNSSHKNSNTRTDALKRIEDVMEKPIEEVEKKLHCIRSLNLALHDSPQICQDEDFLDEPPAEDTINDREAEKSATIIVLESSAGVPEKSSNVSQKPEPSSRKREGARPVKASKYSKLEQKFNHAYDIFTSSINKNSDSDTCFGDYVGESLKKIEDKKVKAWVRHSISNILYQAECGGLAGPFPPIINHGFSNHVHPIQHPPPHM